MLFHILLDMPIDEDTDISMSDAYVDIVQEQLDSLFDDCDTVVNYVGAEFSDNDIVCSLESRINKQNAEIENLKAALSAAEDRIEEIEDELDNFLCTDISKIADLQPPLRVRLPDERMSITHHFRIGGTPLGKGYLIASCYPNTNILGEIFIKMSKVPETSIGENLVGNVMDLVKLYGDNKSEETLKQINKQIDDYYKLVVDMKVTISDLSAFLHGILDQLGISVSLGLQYLIPLESYVHKFFSTRFPPDGLTSNPEIPFGTSIVDYIFRYLGNKFLPTSSLPWKR